MLGYVELSVENGVALCDKCLKVIKNYKYEYETKIEYSWFGLCKKEVRICTSTPSWYWYEKAITNKLENPIKMLTRGDSIHLSLDCYNELLKLSEGDRRANPIFILNYWGEQDG